MTAIHGSLPMGEGTLGLGEIEGPDGERQMVFLYLDSESYQIFFRIELDSDSRDQYLNNIPCYVATVGDVGYVLVLDERPWIGRVRLGEEGIFELPFFPEDFRSRPSLIDSNRWPPPRQATAHQQILEASSMAAGLYARNGYLYLLAREVSAAEGEVAWWLAKLDPEEGREVARARLPSSAANLTIEQGDEFWRLTERGPVNGIGEMHAPHSEILSEVHVPTSWVADLEFSLEFEDCPFVISSVSR